MQLLVVQSLGEVYSAHSSRLPAKALAALLDILQRVGTHARGANTDLKLRQVLAYAQSTDKVPHPTLTASLHTQSALPHMRPVTHVLLRSLF